MKSDYFKEVFTSPVSIFVNIVSYRSLLQQMVRQEIKGRFAGSSVGLVWNFIHPLVTFVVYIFVFVFVFKLKIGPSANAGTSVEYIISGLFPWFLMAEGFSKGTTCLVENANIIKKSPLPTEILAAQSVINPLFSFGFVILVLTIYQAIITGSPQMILIVPVLVLIQLVFTLGVVFLCSAISVFYRDIVHLMQIIIGLGIFLTPIFYHISMLPTEAQKFLYLNPCYPFISLFQTVFLGGSIFEGNMLLLAIIWAGLFFSSGAFVFNKLKYEFADWL